MTLFVGVLPPKLNGWRNTQILQAGVMNASDQEVTYQPFWQCMRDGAQKLAVSMGSMSEKQKRMIQERHDAQ